MPVIDVDELLCEARDTLVRVTPEEAKREATEGALLIDIRSDNQLAADGPIRGAVHVARNVLEWRLDPQSAHALRGLTHGDRVILVCNEGYQSSLAAATLRRFGLDATDIVDGFQAWRRGEQPLSAPASTQPGAVL